MTNPNNAIGTNAAYSGRTSPNALNDVISGFTQGILSGWACSPKTGMTVQVGGITDTRDVALAEDNNGNKLTIDNRSGAPVEVTLAGAPVANNRVDVIVAYVDNPATGDGSTTDNPGTCGIIPVSGTVAANPTAPSEATIRSAITTDGATGGTAYYVILASILVGTGVTTIGSGVITQGDASQSLAAIADGSVTTAKLADDAVTSQKVDWTTMPGVQVKMVQSNDISFTSTGPGTLLVFGVISNVWGYGGGVFRVGITKTAGTQTITNSVSEVSSEGNTVGRSVGAKAVVEFTASGQTISLRIDGIDGASVQNAGSAPSMVAVFFPSGD